jgi:2-polyprenyl-3-methyl-5-hydroxy-6-metoxy-1,4-benzoquinol methylase
MEKHLDSILDRLSGEMKRGVPKAQMNGYLKLLDSVNLSKGSKVLSVSCGDGMFDYLTMKKYHGNISISATDIVDCPVKEEDIKLIRQSGNWNFTRVKPEEPLPFEPGSFDMIFHHDVFEHVKKPYAFLSDHYRLLKPNGYFVFSTPNLFRPANVMKLLLGKLTFPLKIGYFEEIGDYVHIQEYADWSLRIILEEAGFYVVETVPSFFGIHFLNLKFSEYPQSSLGKTMSHYHNFLTQKK